MTSQRNSNADARASGPLESPNRDQQCLAYARTHLQFGWWSLLAFLSLGIVLEAFHGLKIGWFLDPDNDTRRLMWRLAHTHGTLLGVVNILFAGTVYLIPAWKSRSRSVASACLLIAGVLMPVSFLLGGTYIYAGDPGLGIFLILPAAALLLVGVLSTAWAVTRFAFKSRG